jgi:nitrogen regulatory protein PII
LLSIPSTREENNLVEETDDLSSNVLATSLLVVHDTGRGGEDDVSELTRGEELDNPLLEVTELDVVAGGDDTSLVETILSSVLYLTTRVRRGRTVH